MDDFSALFRELDQTTSTNRKITAMVAYFRRSDPADCAWAVYFLSGNRLKRLVNTRLMRDWIGELTGYPEWLITETYAAVGDLAETIALLLDDPVEAAPSIPLHRWIEERIAPLAGLEDEDKRARITGWWRELKAPERFLVNKLITGAFRVGVSRRLVTRALADLSRQDSTLIAHRLMGDWQPSAEAFEQLVSDQPGPPDPSTPYPFFLASPLDGPPEDLGDADDWSVEWKWDGIRAQLICRDDRRFLWSRGEDQLTGRFPEIEEPARRLPEGTVIDGEILAWQDGSPLPFSVLQQRIGRKTVGPKILARAPAALLAYDLLEVAGEDVRRWPLQRRRERLGTLVADVASSRILLSETLRDRSWNELAELRTTARDRGVEGFVLKRRDSPYRVGRRRGDWWKWKVDPYTIDAVMIYAQPGHGRRSNLYTDYTLALWTDEDQLVPVAKAYSGLDNQEIAKLDRWIRRNTTERFGPVRAVEPLQVFELAFEGINPSKRHKSGIALRFPRIARWRRDLSARDADRLSEVRRLLPDGL